MELNSETLIQFAINPQLFNEKIQVANIEQKKFLGKVKKITLKARNATIQIAFSAGQSNDSFIKLDDGISYNEDLIDTPEDFIIYFQSANVAAVLEIIIWQ